LNDAKDYQRREVGREAAEKRSKSKSGDRTHQQALASKRFASQPVIGG